jgi:Fur family ferric uptake transcriptional regulator
MVRLSINETFSEGGRRLTGTRRALAALIDDERHFTASELLEKARRGAVPVGRATVFRTLELLTEMGALERIDLPGGEHAYVVCQPEGHHHHVVCLECGRAVEVGDLGLQPVVDDIARRTGYLIDTHRLEFFGLCPLHRSSKENRS